MTPNVFTNSTTLLLYIVISCDLSYDLCLQARHISKLQRAPQRPPPRSCLVVTRETRSFRDVAILSRRSGWVCRHTSLQGRLRLPSLHCTDQIFHHCSLSSGGNDLIIHVCAPQLFAGYCYSHKPGANHPSAANLSRSPRDSKTPGVQIAR